MNLKRDFYKGILPLFMWLILVLTVNSFGSKRTLHCDGGGLYQGEIAGAGFYWSFPTSAGVQLSAQEILKMVDARSVGEEAPSDLQAKMVMRIIDSRQNEKRRELRVWSKNRPGEDDWRVMKFLSPPDVRGVGFLVLADDQMYLYLPEFRRIRRIASHNKSERFMGSDFSYEDLSTGGFARFYQATLLDEDATTWHLELVLKAGADKPYPRVELWVDKETHLLHRFLLYDRSGEVWKEAFQEVSRIGDYWVPVKTTMKDLKAHTKTILTMEEIQVNVGLEEGIFTQRFLKRRVR
ncbi:outer membrane lipoprotein-sorting protein [Candidatus Aminicenantes bacterium AC-334-K16]|jgi:outer membrane lipoprotein-sorting protein|nr:outer membrane lipoprotein-sorting protein [Candidatus Aminicenantes bacterium AC-334-K16]